MGNYQREPARAEAARKKSLPAPAFCFLLIALALSCFVAGCAAPSEPAERKPPVPTAVADLTAAQLGDNVILTFTLPKETVDRRLLKQPPAVEIYRAVRPTSPSTRDTHAPEGTPKLVATVPSDMVAHYTAEGRFRYLDALTPGDFSPPVNSIARYTVRTRSSVKRESEDSNIVSLPVFPAPDAIEDLRPEITHAGVVLTWTPPEKNLTGSAPSIVVYHIYRTEERQAAQPAGVAGNLKTREPLVQIASTTTPGYTDVQAQFDHTYVYSVRSVAQYADKALESADSNSVTVTPKDVFPPAAPQGLVAVLVPGQGESPAHLELSWAISAETDIAGYNIYRSEQEGAAGTRLNAELLRSPAFRDTSTVAGRRYSYSVTAVDRAGNESPASDAVVAGIPAESQPQP
jgi:hypothetical protein